MKSIKPIWLKTILLLWGVMVFHESGASTIDSLIAIRAKQGKSEANVQTTIQLAMACRSAGKINQSETYLNEGLTLSREIGYRWGEATILKNLGHLKLSAFITPFDEITTLFMQSLATFEELNDSSSVGECLMQLGIVNYSIGNFSIAAENFNESISSLPGDSPLTPTCRYLLGLCYSEIGRYKEAEFLLQRSLVDYALGDDNRGLMVKSFLGKLMFNQNKYHESALYLEQALREFKNINDSSQSAPAHAFLSSTYLALKDYDAVIKHGELALKYGDIYSGMIYYLEATNNLHRAYAAQGDMTKAYQILYERQRFADSTHNNRVMANVATQKAAYEFEKEMVKEKAKQRIDQELAKHKMQEQRILIYVFISGFAILFIFSVVIYRQRSKIGHEKAASEKLLLNILPEEVAQELKEFGKAEARDYDGVSILFTDFKEFTQKSEKMTPTELVELINTCFKAFDHICENREIEKIKTIGDSYMAAAGFNVESKTAACRTVKAGIDMNRFVLEQLGSQVHGASDNFQMRVGVNTGPVVAGIVGVKKFQYDLWGDTVNTASRMESHGEVGRVNISQHTYELIKEDPAFTFEHRGKVSAKGKGEIDMWFVDLV